MSNFKAFIVFILVLIVCPIKSGNEKVNYKSGNKIKVKPIAKLNINKAVKKNPKISRLDGQMDRKIASQAPESILSENKENNLVPQLEYRAFFTVSPSVYYSRLDARDKFTGASAYLLSDLSYKISGEILFPINDYNFIQTEASFTEVIFSPVLSSRTVEGMRVNLGEFRAGYVYQSSYLFKALVGYEQRIHFTPDATSIKLKPVPVPTVSLIFGYDCRINSRLKIRLLGDYKYLMPTSIPSLDLEAGQEMGVSVGPNLSLKNNKRLGVDFKYTKSQEESNLVHQNYQQIGGTMWFASSF